MTVFSALPEGLRTRGFAAATRLLAVCLLPAAFARRPGRTRYLACQWALAARFPHEEFAGMYAPAVAAFTAARTEAFWRDGRLIGLTDGHRDAAEQTRIFAQEVMLTGSAQAALRRVLPSTLSAHVQGIAMDVRPSDGAQWLEEHGGRYHLYRIYDNEWWHFEYRPEYAGTAPQRLPHPGATASLASNASTRLARHR